MQSGMSDFDRSSLEVKERYRLAPIWGFEATAGLDVGLVLVVGLELPDVDSDNEYVPYKAHPVGRCVSCKRIGPESSMTVKFELLRFGQKATGKGAVASDHSLTLSVDKFKYVVESYPVAEFPRF